MSGIVMRNSYLPGVVEMEDMIGDVVEKGELRSWVLESIECFGRTVARSVRKRVRGLDMDEL